MVCEGDCAQGGDVGKPCGRSHESCRDQSAEADVSRRGPILDGRGNIYKFLGYEVIQKCPPRRRFIDFVTCQHLEAAIRISNY